MYILSFFDPKFCEEYTGEFNYRIIAELCAVWYKLQKMENITIYKREFIEELHVYE